LKTAKGRGSLPKRSAILLWVCKILQEAKSEEPKVSIHAEPVAQHLIQLAFRYLYHCPSTLMLASNNRYCAIRTETVSQEYESTVPAVSMTLKWHPVPAKPRTSERPEVTNTE
jgi:hypothetical protein